MPVLPPARLEVRYLGAYARSLHEVYHLVYRLEYPVALGAHVRRVESAARRGDLCKGNNLFGRRVFAGLVDESRRESPSAGVERLGEEALHLPEFAVSGCTSGIADDGGAQGVVSDELHGVDCGLRRGKHIAVLCERAPGEPVAEKRGPVAREARLAVARRDGSAALSVDLRRDALRHLRRSVRLDDEIRVGMRMRVEESGAHDAARGVDGGIGSIGVRPVGCPHDVDDSVAFDKYVAVEAGSAGAVYDKSVLDDCHCL